MTAGDRGFFEFPKRLREDREVIKRSCGKGRGDKKIEIRGYNYKGMRVEMEVLGRLTVGMMVFHRAC